MWETLRVLDLYGKQVRGARQKLLTIHKVLKKASFYARLDLIKKV